MALQAGPNAATGVIGSNTNRFQTSDVQLHVEERDQLTALVRQLEGCDSRDDELATLRDFVADPAKLPATEALLAMIKKYSPRAAPTQKEILSELPPSHLEHMLTAKEASDFEKNGFLLLPNALPPAKLREMQETFNNLESTFRPKLDLNIHERLNLLDCLALDERLLELTDWVATFPKVWGIMGWHISLYIAQATVYPATAERGELEMTRAQRQRPETGAQDAPPPNSTHVWHRDSGKFFSHLRDEDGQDSGHEPRVSLKVAFALSDMDERTGLQFIPGTHLGQGMIGTMMHIPAELGTSGSGATKEWWDKEWGNPPTAIGIPMKAGDAALFDRRLFHSEPLNPYVGSSSRRMVFLGYSHRWLRPRDEMSALGQFGHKCGPIRRQLLGAGPSGGTGYTSPEDVPLRDWVRHYFGEEGLSRLGRNVPLTADQLKHSGVEVCSVKL